MHVHVIKLMHAAKEIVLSKVFWEYVIIVFENLKMETTQYYDFMHRKICIMGCMFTQCIQLKNWAEKIQMEIEN